MVKDIIFIGISIVIVASAVMAVGFKSTLHNAFSLMLCLAGVAGIFILLSGEFVAVMEIVVYVGAVAIAIIFAIMFSPPLFMTQPKRSLLKVMRSAAIAVFFFLAIYKVITATSWIASSSEGDYSVKHLGQTLLGIYALPFEVIGIALLISILGALLMAKKRNTDE